MQKENTTNKGGNLDQPNVNESLALAGLFRKVSVQERLPKEDGEYTTNYCLHTKLLTCAGKRKWTIKAGGDTLTVTPDFWLEQIELPTDEEVKEQKWIACKNDDGINKPYWDGKEMDGFIKGAKWIRDFVLAGKAVTAKDNVR